MTSKIRTYSELRRIDDFEERYRYLALHAAVADATFGFDRYLNQGFYRSKEWRSLRIHVIARDLGCDLGLDGYDISEREPIYIHHMNPMTPNDIRLGNPDILDPEFLVSVRHPTHNAIHYGDERQLPRQFVPRSPGDTKLW